MNRHSIQSLLLGLALLPMSACNDGAAPAQAGAMKSHHHPIGLAVEAPTTFSIQQTANGFVFTADGANRYPTEIAIEFRRDAAPSGNWSEHHLKSRTVNRRVNVEYGTGSGGDDHQLQAWEQLSNGYLWLEQEIQVEAPQQPDFSSAWQIFESARMTAN
jgi:hypothetical protein